MRHRTISLVAAAAVAMLAISSCAGGAADQALDPDADITEQSLVIGIWADYYPADIAETFEAATGVKATIVNHATNEEAMAKITAGGDSGIDVAFVSGQYAQALNDAGLVAPLDKSMIPNESNLYPEAAELPYDVGNVFSMPYAWGTTGLCYRSDLVSNEPTSWNDLLNPAPDVTGKTTMLATERWLVLPALKALGYSVNTTDQSQLDEAKAQMLKTKETLLAFDDTTFYSKLVSGEASLVEAWDGWCNYGIAEDPNIKFVVPTEGSDLWTDTMTVLQTSKNKEAAMAFINYILEADIHSWVVENILYKVPNKAAMEQVDSELFTTYPNLAMTPSELLEEEGIVDVGEFTPEYTRLVTEILAAN